MLYNTLESGRALFYRRITNLNKIRMITRFFHLTRPCRHFTGIGSDVAKNLFLAIVILFIIVIFLAQPVRVEGTSMEPQLGDQERVFINKFSYRIFDIQRGDVVVFTFPGDSNKSFIKRVVGLPGETIKISGGNVYINNKLLSEPYVPQDYRGSLTAEAVTIPPDNYFVMGDHRTVSNDSRHWGTLHQKHIFGKAVLKYWPLDDIGLVN